MGGWQQFSYWQCKNVPARDRSKDEFFEYARCLPHRIRWKLLLSLATEGREAINTHCVHCTKPSWIPTSHEQHINDVSNDSAIRMMWIRNPYSRILSAFLDKMHEPHGQQAKRWKRIVKYHGGPYESTPEGFERFVERLLYMRDNNIEVNPHFTPMAEHCGIDKGMQYDLYLQVEKINEWYAEVIDLLGLSEFVKSGWSSLQVNDMPALCHAHIFIAAAYTF